MTSPVKPEPARGAPIAGEPSPFQRLYLRKQADAIRARGGDDAAVRQFVEMSLQAPPTAQVSDPIGAIDPDVPSNLRGLSMAVAQGATLGWGDEAIGGTLGLLTGVGARKGIEDYRAEYTTWAREHRKASIAGELAGGLATGGFFGGGKTLAAQFLTGAAAGAIAGAGASTNDDLSWSMVGDRFQSAVIGSVVGGAVGFGLGLGITKAIGPVGGTLARPVVESNVGQAVARAVRRVPLLGRIYESTPEGRAYERLAAWMDHEGLTVADVEARAQAMVAQGRRPTALDVFGDQFLEYAGGVLKDRIPEAQQVIQELTRRQGQQANQLIGYLLLRSMRNPKLGLGNVYNAEAELHAQGLAASKDFYAQAHEQVVQVTDAMRRELQRPELRQAWARGAKTANGRLETGIDTQGLPVPPLQFKEAATREAERALILARGIPKDKVDIVLPSIDAIPSELPVRGIDYLKRYLQEPLRALYRSGKMTRTVFDQELSVLARRYSVLTDEAVKQVPVFGRALDAYSGPMSARDAVTQGYQRFLSSKPDAWVRVTNDLAKLSPNDRDFYRIGAARAEYQKALAPSNIGVAESQFGGRSLIFDKAGRLLGKLDSNLRRALALFHGNDAAANDFVRLVAGEARASKTFNRATALPSKVLPQKLKEAEVGAIPQVRGSLGLTFGSAARQALTSESPNMSKAEQSALVELFGKGLQSPADFTVLMHELDYVARLKPLNIAGRAVAVAGAQVGGAFAGIF